MHRDQSPLRARPQTSTVLPLVLEVDLMLDEFTRQPMRAHFAFYPREPAVIRVEFTAGRGSGLVRSIGRELLQHGLTAMSGFGEVRMWPTLSGERPSSWLLLDSREVEALFEVPAGPLAEWLGATYRVTSAEAELDGLHWDGFLRELLDGGDSGETV